MDWATLAPIVGQLAPTLGRLLGGGLPIPFGSSIGEMVGRAIAEAIGAPEPTPDSIAATIAATPADVVKAQLAAAESEASAKWQALATIATAESTVAVAQVTAVNATIRAELLDGNFLQKAWRPLAMYVWICSWPFQLGMILWHVGSADPQVLERLAGIIAALTAWNVGPAALAGVYSWGRTKEKEASVVGVSTG